MKKIILMLGIFIIGLSSFAQINDIKKKSNQNNSNNNSNNRNSENNSSNPGDPCLAACATSMIEIAVDVFAQVIYKYNQQLLENSNDPYIISLEIMPHFGYGIHFSENQQDVYKYYDFLPRIRGNYGAFSTEFRLDYLFEINDSVAFNSFRVFNWQFGFNIIPSESFRLTLGQGVMYEIENRTGFHESFLAADIALKDKLFIISPEGRIAFDYTNNQIAYLETSIRGSYNFLKFKHLNGYVCAGLAYRDYYQSHAVIIPYGGLNFIIY